jgi:hypothetical protein
MQRVVSAKAGDNATSATLNDGLAGRSIRRGKGAVLDSAL